MVMVVSAPQSSRDQSGKIKYYFCVFFFYLDFHPRLLYSAISIYIYICVTIIEIYEIYDEVYMTGEVFAAVYASYVFFYLYLAASVAETIMSEREGTKLNGKHTLVASAAVPMVFGAGRERGEGVGGGDHLPPIDVSP